MEKTKTASLSGVYILDLRQDLVLTVNTFGPKTVLLESNLFYPFYCMAAKRGSSPKTWMRD